MVNILITLKFINILILSDKGKNGRGFHILVMILLTPTNMSASSPSSPTSGLGRFSSCQWTSSLYEFKLLKQLYDLNTHQLTQFKFKNRFLKFLEYTCRVNESLNISKPSSFQNIVPVSTIKKSKTNPVYVNMFICINKHKLKSRLIF